MSNSFSPADVNIFDLVCGSNVSHGNSPSELQIDAECSEQFHGLAIHQDSDRGEKSSASAVPYGKNRQSKPSTVIRCTTCSKTFNNSSALAKHKLIHSEERKYTCQQCSKSFKRQDHLNGHLMTHSTKKPFGCKFVGCDKSYCDARSLRRHYENHHNHLLEANSLGASDPCLTPHSAAGDSATPGSGGERVFTFDVSNGSPSALTTGSASDANDLRSPLVISPGGNITQLPHGLWTGEVNPFDEPKPIQCMECKKSFRNLPALNGHMRLHGGYSRKDGEQTVAAPDMLSVTSSGFSFSTEATSDVAQSQIDEKLVTSPHLISPSHSLSEVPLLVSRDQQLTGDVDNTDWQTACSSQKVASAGLIPDNIQAILVDGCQLINTQQVPTLLISQPASCCDVSGTVFVEMDTSTGCSLASAGTEQVGMVNINQSQPYALAIDQSGTQMTSLPLLINNSTGNVEMMLTDANTNTIDIPVITANHTDLSNVHMTTLPSSTVVLFSPAPTTPTVVPAPTYQIVSQLTTGFPSPCTPGSSGFAIGCVGELIGTQVANQSAGVSQTNLQSPAFVPFPTPQTPSSLQANVPVGENYFRFSLAKHGDLTARTDSYQLNSQSSTPVYTMPVPQQLFSPQTPFTPATPSIFQFPPASIAAVNSVAGSSSQFVSQKHHAMFHPYSQPAKEMTSPHILKMQMRKAEERKKFEQDIAEAHHEIEHHLQQLKQEDLFWQQQKLQANAVSSEAACATQLDVTTLQVDDVLEVLLAEETEDLMTTHDNETRVSSMWTDDEGVNKPAKRKQKPVPLVIPASVSNFRPQVSVTTLRRSLQQMAPYTPPPMRSPLWTGHGRIQASAAIPQSAPPYHISLAFSEMNDIRMACGQTNDSDVQPHVNIGPQFQAELPSVSAMEAIDNGDNISELLVWDPKLVEGLSDEELSNYQNFACSAPLPGIATNREYALHLLHMCNGHIKAARLKLVKGGFKPAHDSQRDEWSPNEVNIYSQALIDTNKDFNQVAKKVGSKTVKQCVHFYYLWKKVCCDEYAALCHLRHQLRNQSDDACESMDITTTDICRQGVLTSGLS